LWRKRNFRQRPAEAALMHRFRESNPTRTECNPDFLSLIDSMARESCSPSTAILELLLMTSQTRPFSAIFPNLRTMGRAITSQTCSYPVSPYHPQAITLVLPTFLDSPASLSSPATHVPVRQAGSSSTTGIPSQGSVAAHRKHVLSATIAHS